MSECEVMVIGAAIADVLLCPVDESVFLTGSSPVDRIRLSVGGDAMNEATILARLGHAPVLVTKLGCDATADLLLSHCRREGIFPCAAREAGLDTGINAVLVQPDGERSFVTNRNGSLRKLSLADILPALETEAFRQARAVCLASMFVSAQLGLKDMEVLFGKVKAAGKILCADSTRRKNGETLKDAAGALKFLDYFFPNLEEAALLTGLDEPDAIADALLEAGVSNVVLKMGRRGCLMKNRAQRVQVPAYPEAKCIDTTGAGDNFAAGLIAAILEGRSFARCGAYANAAASVCVESLGATEAKTDRTEIARRSRKIEDLL